jgi:hypothetical protein
MSAPLPGHAPPTFRCFTRPRSPAPRSRVHELREVLNDKFQILVFVDFSLREGVERFLLDSEGSTFVSGVCNPVGVVVGRSSPPMSRGGTSSRKHASMVRIVGDRTWAYCR